MQDNDCFDKIAVTEALHPVSSAEMLFRAREALAFASRQDSDVACWPSGEALMWLWSLDNIAAADVGSKAPVGASIPPSPSESRQTSPHDPSPLSPSSSSVISLFLPERSLLVSVTTAVVDFTAIMPWLQLLGLAQATGMPTICCIIGILITTPKSS